MHKSLLLAVLLSSLNVAVYAGDNSQATLGDVKEAVYKLIVQNKANTDKSNLIDARVENIENTTKESQAKANKKDEIDMYISSFVSKNEQALQKIKQTRE
ncbi:MAG: hypothetical protein WC656_01840 [Sulfurimonas sp.]|jgi:hypothetical protein